MRERLFVLQAAFREGVVLGGFRPLRHGKLACLFGGQQRIVRPRVGNAQVADLDAEWLDVRFDARAQRRTVFIVQLQDTGPGQRPKQRADAVLARGLQDQVEVRRGDGVHEAARIGNGKRHQHVNAGSDVVAGEGFGARQLERNLAARDDVRDGDPRHDDVPARSERAAVSTRLDQQRGRALRHADHERAQPAQRRECRGDDECEDRQQEVAAKADDENAEHQQRKRPAEQVQAQSQRTCGNHDDGRASVGVGCFEDRAGLVQRHALLAELDGRVALDGGGINHAPPACLRASAA